MLSRLLVVISSWARFALPLGIVFGLLFPQLADVLRPTVTPSIMGLLVIGLLRSPPSSFTAHLQRPALPLAMLVAILLLAPFLVTIVADSLALPGELRNALVLAASAPAIMSGAALAPMLGLDAALATLLIIISTLASSFTVPVIAGLTGASEGGSFWHLLTRSLIVIGVCVLAAHAAYRALGSRTVQDRARELDGISVVLLTLFATGIMAGVTETALRDPMYLLTFVAAAAALNLGLQLLGFLMWLGAGRRIALTFAFVFGNRNTSLILAVMPEPIAPTLILFVAAAQFPIYLMPPILWRIYRTAADETGKPPLHR